MSQIITPEITAQDVEDYFSFGSTRRTNERKQLPSGVYQGRCFDPNPSPHDDVCRRTTFQKTYSLVESSDSDEEVATTTIDPYGSLISGDMENLEIETIPPMMTFNTSVSEEERRLDVYDHYDFTHEYNKDLPITAHRTEILGTINANPVTIIEGSTGSGKTTQVPQFILDEYKRKGKYCNIVVTQPRRIAAISIANRVCQERNWTIGYLVGYQVGLDKKTSEDTRITYVTTGVLLRHLIKTKNMNEYTHVVLDEVHERDEDTDFAMLLVRKLLRLNSKQVKVILMSATFETEVLADYFGYPIAGTLMPAPKIKIGGRMFAVKEHYLENVDFLGTCPLFNLAIPEISYEVYATASRLIVHLDTMEQQERANSPGSSSAAEAVIPMRGSVLVFLPGIFQIREMEEALNYHRVSKKLNIIPLHSSITMEEQSLVFTRPKPGHRKVILSTNIAESSITVPDIKYVIDFCLTKAMVCDIDTNYQSLRLQWASQASGKQRAGRAGRVSNGKVFRLVTRDFWHDLSEYAEPEMQRCSLENTILKVKILDLGEPKEILSLALSPPAHYNIERTILLLKEIGAISTTSSQKRLDGDLTFVGRVLAALPIDMRLGKLLMLGFVFGCFSDCLIIAAALSKPSFFATPYKKALEAYAKKFHWAQGSFSDCIAMLNAYKEWYRCDQTQKFRRKSDEKEWGRENYVQIRRIHEVQHQIEELRSRLRHFNIRSDDMNHWNAQDPQYRELILLITMAGAFYPNYFEQSNSDEDACLKEMSLLDPAKTTMFTGLPSGKGPLFRDALLNVTKPCGKQKAVYYDGSKAYVEFEDTKELDTGNVLPAVYLASKLRSTSKQIQLRQSFAEKKREPNSPRPHPFLYEPVIERKHGHEVPRPGSKIWFPMHITDVSSPNMLWGNKLLPLNIEYLTKLRDTIANEISVRIHESSVLVGSLVLAPFDDGDMVAMYRALLTKLRPSIQVWFVDYGNYVSGLSYQDLRQLPASLKDIPFQAIQLRLRGIQKVASKSSEDGIQLLQSIIQTSQNPVQVKIYSVVSDVVCVDMFTDNDVYVNEVLVQQGVCEIAEEGKLSNISHSSWELAEEEGIINERAFERRYTGQWKHVDEATRGAVIPRATAPVFYVSGPRSTYEVCFSSLISIGRLRNVSIDPSSINSICINQNPLKSSGRLMIAAEVGINQTGSTMLARNTTLMPDIPGLCQLLCLIFAPVAELRVDPGHVRNTGVICGLGSMKSRELYYPVLPDHDIELEFTTELPLSDIADINGIRMLINIAVGGGEKRATWSQSVLHGVQDHARNKLLSLLFKKRNSITATPCQRPYTWRLIKEEDLAPHSVNDIEADCKDLYRLHDGVLLQHQPID